MDTGQPQLGYVVVVEPVIAKTPRRRKALLLACFVTGLGQAYLGHWRRATLWATAPLLLDLAFAVTILRFERRGLYAWFLAVAVSAWVVPRILAFLEVRSLQERPSGGAGFVRLGLFALGAVFYGLAMLVFEGAEVARTSTMQSNTMQPTLLVHDRLVVDLIAYRTRSAKRGELVAFDSLDRSQVTVVERVIGVAADRMEVTAGELRINGWPVPHCVLGQVKLADSQLGELQLEFLGDSAYLTFGERAHDIAPQAWTTAPGELSVLSDNRSDNTGRAARAEQVSGRPAFVYLGLGYDGSIDWSRIGMALDRPQLPGGLEGLEPRLRQCLATRPPRSQTEPPPPH